MVFGNSSTMIQDMLGVTPETLDAFYVRLPWNDKKEKRTGRFNPALVQKPNIRKPCLKPTLLWEYH